MYTNFLVCDKHIYLLLWYPPHQGQLLLLCAMNVSLSLRIAMQG